jgi:DNA topoisomerase-1
MADRGDGSIPTEIGVVVCDLLVKNFPYIFDTAYTAKLEEELDDIEEGKEKWTDLLNGFYDYFEEELKDAGKNMENIKRMEQVTGEKCELCGSPLLLKWGKFGTFFACSAYNKKDPTSCTFTKENIAGKPDLNTPEAQEAGETEEYCENCGKVMILRRGLFGPFMSCPDYNADPPCKTFRKLSQKQQQKPPEPTGEDCPACGKPLVLRQGAYGEFVSCSGYPKCKYIKQNLIEGMKCPKCGTGDLAERKARRGNVFWGCTNYPKCDFTSNLKPVAKKCPECGSPYLLEKTLKSGISWSARTRRRAPRKRLRRRSGARRRLLCRLKRARRWCAATRSELGMRRLRRPWRRMGRWWRRRAGRRSWCRRRGMPSCYSGSRNRDTEHPVLNLPMSFIGVVNGVIAG